MPAASAGHQPRLHAREAARRAGRAGGRSLRRRAGRVGLARSSPFTAPAARRRTAACRAPGSRAPAPSARRTCPARTWKFTTAGLPSFTSYSAGSSRASDLHVGELRRRARSPGRRTAARTWLRRNANCSFVGYSCRYCGRWTPRACASAERIAAWASVSSGFQRFDVCRAVVRAPVRPGPPRRLPRTPSGLVRRSARSSR